MLAPRLPAPISVGAPIRLIFVFILSRVLSCFLLGQIVAKIKIRPADRVTRKRHFNSDSIRAMP
jgi:hypothetical protein